MNGPARSEPRLLRVGGLTRAQLMKALRMTGVQLNGSAMTLLDDAVFDNQRPRRSRSSSTQSAT